MKKRSLTILIIMILMFTVVFQVSANGGKETESMEDLTKISSKAIEPTFMFRSNLSTLNSDSLIFQYIGDMTNIYFDAIPVGVSDFAAKISTVIASGDMPDLISLRNGKNLTAQYGPQGAWVPLNSYVESGRMPNFKKAMDEVSDDSWQVLKVGDGNYYGTPRIYTYAMLHESFMARTDLMREWGFGDRFENPDDLTNFLRKAKEVYPNSNPVSNRWGANTIIRGMAHQYHSDIKMFFDYDQDKYVYGPTKEGFKEFMDYLRTWYEEGLLEPDWGNTTDAQWEERLLNNQSFFVYDYMTVADDMTNEGKKTNPDYEYQAVVPFSGDSAHNVGQAEKYHDVYFLLQVISAKSKYVEELVDFLEWKYTEEGINTVLYGKEGDTFTKEADGSIKLTSKVKTLHNPDGTFVPAENGVAHEFTSIETLEYAYAYGMGELARNGWSSHKEAGAVMIPQPKPNFTEDETLRKAQIESAINTFMDELMVNMIMGRADIANWDEEIKELNGMGLEELVNIYNAAYDRDYR